MTTTNLIKNLSLIATATATLGIFAQTANALTLSSSSGTWSNTIGGSSVSENVLVGSENQVRWGTDLGNGQSGLGFTGVGITNFNPGDSFLLGTLRHFNNPIGGGSAASQTTLGINLDFSTPLTNQSFSFDLAIDETPNTPPCSYPSSTPCADRISFPNAFPGNSFNIGGTDYTLQLLGFSDAPGGTLVNDFISQEGGTNSAYLYGRITEYRQTPEPTATMAFLGLAALATGKVIKRKK